MKRVAFLRSIALVSCFTLSACLPLLGNPAFDLPSPTPEAVQNTSPAPKTITVPTVSTEFPPSQAFFPTGLFTPIPSFTPTSTKTSVAIPLATETPSLHSLTAILVTDTVDSAGSIGIDKLPANTVYKPAHIQNISRTQVDFELHCTTNHGLQTVLEYENLRNVFTMLPEGNYFYVVYVGGKRLVGNFTFITNPKLFIVIDKDRVVIH